MDDHLQIMQKRIKSILDILDTGTLSEENYDSTQEPFFQMNNNKEFKQDFKRIPELPHGLNANIRHIYEIIGNSKVEVNLKNNISEQWIFMTLDKALKIYEDFKSQGQTTVFDIAYTYRGMGHIRVLSCDLMTHKLFFRPDGGSNMWDRDLHNKQIINYNTDNYDYFYFMDWFSDFAI